MEAKGVGTTDAMVCSICNEPGHNRNNRTFHPRQDEAKDAGPRVPLKSVKKAQRANITEDEAVASWNEWMPYIRNVFIQKSMDPKQQRDIGKLLAPAAEDYVNDFLETRTGRRIEMVNGKAYDGETVDGGKAVRHQTKFRADAWHLESTRRNSAKNEKTNATGHVAYTSDEFDMLAIFIPGRSFGIGDSNVRCIPVKELVNPKKPDQLLTNIPRALRDKYDSDEGTSSALAAMYL